jgi:hypothetical protein
MQKWYEHTAERVVPQMETLASFISRQGLNLPQLDEDQRVMLEEEFTPQEVKAAISEANEVSALVHQGKLSLSLNCCSCLFPQ